ncbi:MAG TPA: PAS domain S-box protein [Deltaproteobacteria bacterium]|nr:PAS domain S-box protein [Deltaproteobacteria bacterium]
MALSAAYLIGFCFALLTAIPSSAWEGPPPARLAPGFSKVDLTEHMEVLEDRDGRLGIEDIITGTDLAFRTPSEKDIRVGYTRSAYWVRLAIENSGPQSLDWLLEYGQTYAHTVELYEPTPRGYRRISTGNDRPYDERPYDALTFVFPIHQPPGISTYYLHIASYNRIELVFTAWSKDSLHASQIRQYISVWFAYAFILAMILYNFVLFFFIRERSYLFFVMFLFTNLLFLMCFDGTGFKYLWPQALWWESVAITVTLILQHICGILFFQTFVHLKRLAPRFKTFLDGVIVLELSFVGLKCAVPRLPIAQYVQPVLLITTLAMILMSIQLLRKGSREAFYYLVAALTFFAFAMLNSLMTMLILPPSLFLHYGMHAGAAVLAVLLSLGLADRINTMRIRNQEGETRYRTLFESANDAILIMEDETIVNGNRRAEEIFKCGRSDLVGRSIARLLPRDHPDRAPSSLTLETVRDRLSSKRPEQFECLLSRYDGTEFPAEVTFNRLELKGKALIQAVIRDISERKRFLDALSASEKKFSEVFRMAPQMITITTRNEGTLLDVNDTFLKLTGLERHEVIGRTGIELGLYQQPGDRGIIMEFLRAGKTIRNLETVLRSRNGTEIPVLMSVEPVVIGERECLLTIISDISDRKRAEEELKASEEARRALHEQLTQAQKMESIGRLAGGIAHDFNNLLSVILGYGGLMQASFEKTNDANRERLQMILKAAERAKDLTRQLLAFGRKQVLEIKPLNLNAVITNFKEMLIRIIGEDIHLKTVLDQNIGLVNADVSQIEQALLNLAVNARDAMQQGGTLTVETSVVTLDEGYALSHAQVVPGRYVMLTVSDTGCGMDAQTLDKVFEPFFTTKATGKGTGLGLSMVYGIVKQHGGYIWVYSELGRGTTFKIYLPESQAGQAYEMPTSAPPAVSSGTETILVVEDDSQVRQLVCELLIQCGYTVIETGDVREALRLASQPGEIHLVLTDIVMPEMSGRQVYEQIARLRPGIKVLYMSGYTEDVIAHHGILEPGIHFIQKPFSGQRLSEKLREALDA